MQARGCSECVFMRGRKSGIYSKIARSTTMEKMMRPDPTDPTRLDQPTDRPTFTYMYMYTYVYIHICIEICIYIFFMCRAGYPVSRPGKAKRESCKKKAHNDGHVPHKRKRNYPAQKVVQQMVEQVGTGGYWWVLVGTAGYRWVLEGTIGYWWVVLGTGGY